MLRQIIIQLVLPVFLCAARVLDVKPEHLTTETGLAGNAVECIYQDHQGFMWFGTQDGLSKYDGYSFTNYRHDPKDSATLSDNTVYRVFDDGRYLWLGTSGKLNRFDPSSNEFKTLAVHAVSSMVRDSEGIIWAGSLTSGLYGIDPHMHIVSHLTKENSALGSNYIRDLLYDDQGCLWVCTDGGGITRIFFSDDSLQFNSFRHRKNDPYSLSSDSVTCACRDSQGNFWFGTRYGGVDILRKSGRFKHLRHTANGLPADEIRTITCCSAFSKSVWIGTYDNGMCYLQKGADGNYDITPLEFNLPDDGIPVDNKLTSIFIDRFGAIWEGTYHSGVYKFTLPQLKFKTYKFRSSKLSQRNSLNYTWSFYEDDKRRIWSGGINGMCLIDSKPGTDNVLKGIPFNGSSKIQVRRIVKDRQGTIWAATLGLGLVKLQLKKNSVTIKPVRYPKSPEGVNNLYCLTVDNKNDSIFWMGSNGAGLIQYNKYSRKTVYHKVDHISPDKRQALGWVCAIYQDKQGILWLGTWNNGLCRFNPRTGETVHYTKKHNGLTNNTIFYIHSSGDSVLWLGTYGGGLNRFDMRTKTVRSYTTNEGLPNNIVYGIVEDNQHNLWISTNKGIAFFSQNDGSVKSFSVDDGLPGNEFNLGACFKNSAGDIFFGSTRGIVHFKPVEVINPRPPLIRLTSFKKYGKAIHFDKPLNQMNALHLGYKDKVLSFEFVGLHYKNSAKNQYAYMLDGLDGDWIYCGTNRKASYHNLSPGKYVFKIKAANCDGVWSEKPLEIPLIIAPPFWHNPWFYLFSFIMLGIVIIAVHRVRVRQILRIETAKLSERERLRRKMAADFHDELGHRVTKISLLSKIALNEEAGNGKPVKSYLQQIAENADGLFTEMKEFVWELDPQKDSLYDLMSQLKNFSGRLFDATDIAFQIEGLNPRLEDMKLNMEWRQNLLRLFKEGMTNILKHAADCHNVRLQIMHMDGHLRITLSDDGPGFDIQRDLKGNGLKNMLSRAEKINGTLKITSSPGAGTKIIFTGKLP